ncbi:MAG: phosphatase PAP2 family protein [Actinomycetota bacterium]|nr:phosphatase PAP2 family protein [Actinomycetota bacterium]
MWIGLALIVLGTAGFFVVLDAVRDRDDLAALDEPVLAALAEGRSEVLTTVLTVITTISGTTVLPALVLAGTLAWGFVRGRWWQAGLLAGAMVLSTIVSVALKRVVARPRPPVDTMTGAGIETSYSFPSGHTIGAATLLLVAGYLVWVAKPAWGSLLRWVGIIVLGILAVALSRLYLGYHFVTDVVASVALAVAVLGVVVVVDRRRAVRAAKVTTVDAA